MTAKPGPAKPAGPPQLSAKYSRIVEVYEKTDLSHQAIAERCGVAIVTVANALEAAADLNDPRLKDGHRRRSVRVRHAASPSPRVASAAANDRPAQLPPAPLKRGRKRGFAGASPKRGPVLDLYAAEDISHAEISRRTGAPAGSVGAWISVARNAKVPDPRVMAGDVLRGKGPRR